MLLRLNPVHQPLYRRSIAAARFSLMPPIVPQYISAEDLAVLLKATPIADAGSNIAVVDVRDDDFRGGNILSAHRLPSAEQTSKQFHELTTHFKDKERVIFHCTLSQVRGPKSARRYAEALSERDPDSKQQIYILREGFAGFQAKYRNDPELVEKFIKACWD